MAGDTDLENDERRSTGTSTAALMIKRPSRLAVQAGATYHIGGKKEIPANGHLIYTLEYILKLGAPGFLKSHWSAGVLLTHIAMSHELQRGTKRTAVHELPLAQQMRVATAVETPSYQ